MSAITSSVTVQRPCQAVFDYMADPHNQVDWSPNFLALVTPPAVPIGHGSRFRGKIKNFGTLDLEYAEFERPARFKMATKHWSGGMTHDFRFSALANGTQITQTVEFHPRGVARLFSPLMAPLLRKMVADLDRQIVRTVDERVSEPAR